MTPEQRARRVHYHTYVTCETPAEHAERIVALEELVLDMWPHVRHRSRACLTCRLGEECGRSDEPCLLYAPLHRRMRDLGLPSD